MSNLFFECRIVSKRAVVIITETPAARGLYGQYIRGLVISRDYVSEIRAEQCNINVQRNQEKIITQISRTL